jgi:hypothetical protein
MRKRIVNQSPQPVSSADQNWLDLEHKALVELSSEDAANPIEGALTPGAGWRAAQAGEQTIRILFDEPQQIRRIHLRFHEEEHERTQEFVLRWSAEGGQSDREIVRQQYHFSPPDTIDEFEDYAVELEGVMALELKIVPDISGGESRASLAQLRLA